MSQTQSLPLFRYNQALHENRLRFAKSPGIEFFLSERSPRKLHAFLLMWTGFSISMTQSVEHWIAGAGESCNRIGLNEIGTHLKRHSQHEAGHDQMLRDDLKVLTRLWNTTYGGSVSAEEIQTMPVPPATKAYVGLHEDVIRGQTPYCQVAIEFEIERLSTTVGNGMIENSIYTLGQEFIDGLSFLAHHVVLDQGHTIFNSKLIESCLAADPNRHEPLVATGRMALQIYSDFLSQCVDASKILW